MDTSKGTFIVLEGTDGAGKSTQFDLLAKRLTDDGYDVATFRFPQYDSPSSYFVTQYLKGAYNNGGTPGPYTASLFYALDRYEAAPKITDALNQGKVVLVDRYVGSNMAHQGTKIAKPEERRGYFIWNDNLEYEMLHIPRPTISYILRVPADVALERITHKESRDVLEDDPDQVRKSVEVYDDLAQLFPKDFTRIDCAREGKMLPIDSIQEILWQKVVQLLPELPEPAPKPAEASVTPPPAVEQSVSQPATDDPQLEPTVTPVAADPPAAEPILRKDEQGGYSLTETGRQFLASQVSNNGGNIYALTGKMQPELTAALIARFAKRAGDLRSTLLLEFADAANRDASLDAAAFQAYGDVSVGQLASAYLVVGGVSNILAKTIEHGRLAAFTEQSVTVSRYEAKDSTGNYNYYTPEHLPSELQASYKQHMDSLFDTY
ncbi:MAG TPA: hypothetical protein VLF43_02025, partial [Candidatus Saccharimonadales bacterium]|nr:hypothetical protein [Candidatus Saccharimonadales bacterium]